MPTKSDTTPPAEATITERADHATDVPTLLLLVSEAHTPLEQDYVWNAIMALQEQEQGDDLERRLRYYTTNGSVLVTIVRDRINRGTVTDSKGETLPVLSSTEPIEMKHVAATLGLRASGDKWTPANGKPIGKTEAQRMWETTKLTSADFDLYRPSVPAAQANNAGKIVDHVAKSKRAAIADAKLTGEQRAAAEREQEQREQAKQAKQEQAKRTEKRNADARHADAGGVSLLPADLLSEATLPDLWATADAIGRAIVSHHERAEAAITAAAQEEAMIAGLAAARGVSVDEMRAVLASLPVAD